jgi:hypothetical protein
MTGYGVMGARKLGLREDDGLLIGRGSCTGHKH